MTEPKDAITLLAEALKLRNELAVTLATLKEQHRSMSASLAQLGDKINAMEQAIGVRDAEIKRYAREIAK